MNNFHIKQVMNESYLSHATHKTSGEQIGEETSVCQILTDELQLVHLHNENHKLGLDRKKT